jgi:predicted AAA+ superfamily ATPase
MNFTRCSQDIGVADSTIANYMQILSDGLIVHTIDPITQSATKRRLIKSPKYLFFDLGVRRACANEGCQLSQQTLGNLFEQFVGIQLLHYVRCIAPGIRIHYWRDTAGPEIDFVIENEGKYYPIKVKWSEAPTAQDAKHLFKFIEEYPEASHGFIVSRSPNPYYVDHTKKILVLPWQQMLEHIIHKPLALS